MPIWKWKKFKKNLKIIKYKMKKAVYITGCFGFIGSYITRLALEKGWYVRGIDKCTYAYIKMILTLI